jgi:uncharacterized protein YbaP (TraB family)
VAKLGFNRRNLLMKKRHTKVTLALSILLIFVVITGCRQNGAEQILDEEYDSAYDVSIADADILYDSADIPNVPLMWRATSPAGQSIYLFGSIHVGDESIYPLPDFIMDAFERSDYLAVEVDLYSSANDLEAAMAITMMMMYQDGTTISDHIGQELHGRMVSALLEYEVITSFPLEMLDLFKPDMWQSTFLMAAAERAGLSAELGLDMYFKMAAAERGMEILEIESIEMQVEIIQGFSQPLQVALLEGALDIEYEAAGLAELFRLWQMGEEEVLIAVLSDFGNMPQYLIDEFNNAMLIERDIAMAEVARDYMMQDKSVFFVVGLAHLIGQDSIVYLLRQSGYTVERILP